MGGTGKTTIAMGICGELERRSIPTLYLDYETNECDCRAVAERMFGAECAKLDLKYRRCERPLYLEAESIAEQVDECGIQFVIVDSAGYACDGRPEDAEVALRYFRALRQLRVGS
jgi:predicted ATP-dependent serine protease